MRFSANFERDWNFFLANRHRLTFCGEHVPPPQPSDGGLSAKEFFYRLDSLGSKATSDLSCREPDLLVEIVRFKKALNLQIKMWADGFSDFLEPVSYYMNELNVPPPWVEAALRGMIARRGSDDAHHRPRPQVVERDQSTPPSS